MPEGLGIGLGQEEEVGRHVSSIDSIAAIESEVFEAPPEAEPAPEALLGLRQKQSLLHHHRALLGLRQKQSHLPVAVLGQGFTQRRSY